MNTKTRMLLFISIATFTSAFLEAKRHWFTQYKPAEHYYQLYASDQPMITLYACSPGACKGVKQMIDLFNQAAQAYPDITFSLIWTWTKTANYELTKDIKSLPRLVFSYKGTEIKRINRAVPEEVLNGYIADFLAEIEQISS